MKRAAIAATAYFLALFALGFLLGTFRVLLVAPRTGVGLATLIETPVMLAAAFFACRWTIRRWRVSASFATRGLMTVLFLALLFVFETVLGASLFGQSVKELLAAFSTAAGLLGLSSQVIAALLPLLMERRRSD